MNELETSLTSNDLRTVVVKLFEFMRLNYGKRFTDQWYIVDETKMIEHWCKTLSGLSDSDLRRGVVAIEKLDWPPSLPEFKKLCRPPVDELVAYYEAIQGLQERKNGRMGVWSHPAIFFAAMRLHYDLMHKSYYEVKERWEKELKIELAKESWATIPKAVAAVEFKRTTSKNIASQHLQHIRSIINRDVKNETV